MSSIDDGARLKVLKQLARTDNPKALAALEREARTIGSILESDTEFNQLNEQLTLLASFAFRVPDLAVAICQRFLERLETLELLHSQDTQWIRDNETNARLKTETLDVLSGIRYFRITSILKTFLSQAKSDDEEVRKKASEVLHTLSEYNINVIYAGKGRGGLGIAPQREILEYLETLGDADRLENFDALVELTADLLSPNVSGTSWDYRSVTWQSGALTPTAGVRDLRQRVLRLLESLYYIAPDVSRKLSVIGAMMVATRMPNHGKPSDDVTEMVSDNTVWVLEFLARILPTQPFPVMQKVEHDAYWRFYHAPTEAVKGAALKIKSLLEGFPEYAIYRDLIGFESIFHPWENPREDRPNFRAIERYRSARAARYAKSIDDDSWEQWRSRIVEFARTESDDLATFPKFYEFLNAFGERRPDLALVLLRENLDDIRAFVIPLLRGIWTTPMRSELRPLILDWIKDGQLLTAITKLFIKNDDTDPDILKRVLERQVAAEDIFGLMQFVSVALSNYEKHPDLVRTLMMPAIQAISAQNSSNWVHEIWFRPELGAVMEGFTNEEREVFIGYLINAPRIDFHEEEILAPIAQEDPERVLRFFGQRIEREKAHEHDREYQAIPYDFHKLHNVLKKSPETAIRTVRSWFDPDDSLFQFKGAKLLSNIFPDFPSDFAQELTSMIQAGSTEDIEFVLAVLRSYDEGQPFLLEVCRTIVAALPIDDPLLSEVQAVFYTTGTTVGEYGIADAYDARAANLSAWLNDPLEKVRLFAQDSIAALKNASVTERRRAAEEIELRKHRFGVNEDESASGDKESDE